MVRNRWLVELGDKRATFSQRWRKSKQPFGGAKRNR